MIPAIVAGTAARVGLTMLFLPFSAADKVFNLKGAVRQASEVFPNRVVAAIVVLAGLAVEVSCSVGVITGRHDRACAFVLAGFCAITALLWKRFWEPGDFWADPRGRGRGLFWDFWKNLSLGAGFLLIVVGVDGAGLADFLADPLASSYARRGIAAAAAPSTPLEGEHTDQGPRRGALLAEP